MDAENAYYSDAPSSEAPEPKYNNEDKSESSKTALLPTDFFRGKELEPGSKCEVRIEQVLDGQVSVSYVGSESDDSDEGEMESEGTSTTEPSTPPASDGMFG